ncbi:BLUF domain-containing protein [Caenimonas koreensis]|uniref:BLUF domain-containing protein n=1 Tax=Caenimonas koreensis DSM 17982 TaxID=1121255 RepID=A0A844B3H7_9BURK|nr:BLUF domain-containing protein [Caenimonas koreensis]MRD47783.1 hypothetical protein [Caenimonas koreensis DSM 17982]
MPTKMMTAVRPNDQDRVLRVVVASESRVHGSVMEQMFGVRHSFMAAEDSKDVHGALLYASGWFVIWLEGSEAGIEATLRRAGRDTRHARMRLIHRTRGHRALADKITLVTTQGADQPFDFARRIHAIASSGNSMTPAAIWHQLSAPCTLPPPGEAPRPKRGIAVMACDDNSSIDVLRKLGDRFASRVVYQRFADGNPASRDVGGAYVDLDLEGHSSRVQVISRRALGHRMVRESLANVKTLALLLGSRPEPAIELAASVALAANTAASMPDIQLVAPCELIARSVGEFLKRGARRPLPAEIVKLASSEIVDFLAVLADAEQVGA